MFLRHEGYLRRRMQSAAGTRAARHYAQATLRASARDIYALRMFSAVHYYFAIDLITLRFDAVHRYLFRCSSASMRVSAKIEKR